MCPTVYGRVQTRWAILIIPAIIATIISLLTHNPSWIVLIGVYFMIGVALDIGFYPFVIRWQPPWLTFVLAVGEFVLTYIAALVLHRHVNGRIVGIHFAHWWLPVIAFWVGWWIAIWTKVVILPLISLSWIEDAGEFRQTGWSIPPEYVPLPGDRVHARAAGNRAAGAGAPVLGGGDRDPRRAPARSQSVRRPPDPGRAPERADRRQAGDRVASRMSVELAARREGPDRT